MFRRTVLGLAALACAAGLAAPAAAWQDWLEGRPTALRQSADTGYYLWHGDDGLHLWTTTGDAPHTFTGTITTDGALVDVAFERGDPGDWLIQDGDRTLLFSFRTDRGTDGVNFRVRGGREVRFDLALDGRQVDADRIRVGRDNGHPKRNPFTVRR